MWLKAPLHAGTLFSDINALTDPPLSGASPLPHCSVVSCGLLHPQYDLAYVVATFHPCMGLGGIGVFVHFVDDRQAPPGGQYRPYVFAHLSALPAVAKAWMPNSWQSISW